MTKQDIKRAIREAKLSDNDDKLIEAFKIMYCYDLIKGSDMQRLMRVLEEENN